MSGNILLVRNNSFIGRQIRRITNSYYDHVAIFLDDDMIIESTRVKGVHINSINKYKFLREADRIEFDIFKLKNPISESEWNRVKSYLLSKNGSRYDMIQLISLFLFFILNINRKTEPIDIEKAFICSELIGKAYDRVNIQFNPNIDLDNITPKDIEDSPIIEKIN